MAKGGKRDGAGRPKGAQNKVNAEIREAAQKYTKRGIRELARLGGLIDGEEPAQSEQARVACINTLLDRGHGKAAQIIAGDEDGGPIQHAVEVTRIERVIVDPQDTDG